MKKLIQQSLKLLSLFLCIQLQAQPTELWHKKILQFSSDKVYDNALYDVNEFYVKLTSPSGKEVLVDGFWNGDKEWQVRLKPDEVGKWQYETVCSDIKNIGLHGVKGEFTAVANTSNLDIYSKGNIVHPKGTYHMTHADGTPFFWMACTAWNGALRSTEVEWGRYLQHRVDNNYNTIQFVTTQWRGAPGDSEGEQAYDHSEGPIKINTAFFERLDKKIDRVNEFGLVASPVILWALPRGSGRHLSPGFELPFDDAMRLGKYIKARFGGNIVVWMLGGDGQYYDEMESRWKQLGRKIFEHKNNLTSLHPHGRSWIGSLYDDEAWMDLVGYQSSHNNSQGTVDWINKGPMANEWQSIRPRPIINMEPCYEEIRFLITAGDVRNASYWSLFATPVSGVTYGANGIWPWLRKGERIINHRDKGGVTDWENSMKFPGSIQMGYLTTFFEQYEWWNLRPANKLLVNQPGDAEFNKFIAVLESLDKKTVLVYTPVKQAVSVRSTATPVFARWFDPVANKYSRVSV